MFSLLQASSIIFIITPKHDIIVTALKSSSNLWALKAHSTVDTESSTSQITTTVSKFNVGEAQILILFCLSVLRSNSTMCTWIPYITIIFMTMFPCFMTCCEEIVLCHTCVISPVFGIHIWGSTSSRWRWMGFNVEQGKYVTSFLEKSPGSYDVMTFADCVYALPASIRKVAPLERLLLWMPALPPAESSAWLDVSATDLSLLPDRRWRSRCSPACGSSPSETRMEISSGTRSSSPCG